MKFKLCSLILLAAVLGLAGCSTPDTRIKHNPELFASIPAPEQELIKQGRIAIGFTPDMVKLAIGEPDYIAHRLDKSGSTEIWRYTSVDYDTTFYGGYWGGGPYWGGYYGWGRPYRYYGGYYGWGGGWGAPATVSDYMRVTFREGLVTEVDQMR